MDAVSASDSVRVVYNDTDAYSLIQTTVVSQ